MSPELPWLQPYPDRLLEPAAPSETEPEAVAVSRETIELAYLAAIQYLPPRQRAVLILRDALGWPAREVASLLEMTVPAANSALQRARSTLRARLPSGRMGGPRPPTPAPRSARCCNATWTATSGPTPTALAALLREDARLTMPPIPGWYLGREAIVTLISGASAPTSADLRAVPTGANRQPAVAWYLRRPGDTAHRALTIDVLRVEGGQIAEITAFVFPHLFPAFDLPPVL